MLTTEHKQQLVVKAMKDEAFRAALLHDATAAAGPALQLTFPAAYRLRVLPADPQHMYLVLPPYPADWPAGLSVEALLERLQQSAPGLEAPQQRVLDGQLLLIAKAWHDAAYKQALLQDPKGVVQREFGEGFPPEVALQVVAEDAQTQYLVLPPSLDDIELSDDQLEQAAGGEIIGTSLLVSIFAAVSGAVSASVTATASFYASKW